MDLIINDCLRLKAEENKRTLVQFAKGAGFSDQLEMLMLLIKIEEHEHIHSMLKQ